MDGCFSHALMFLSLSFPLSLKARKGCPWVRRKKIFKKTSNQGDEYEGSYSCWAVLGYCRHKFSNEVTEDWRLTISSVHTQKIHMFRDSYVSPKSGQALMQHSGSICSSDSWLEIQTTESSCALWSLGVYGSIGKPIQQQRYTEQAMHTTGMCWMLGYKWY